MSGTNNCAGGISSVYCPQPAVLTIYQGDDVVAQPIYITKNGQPVDLTGVTEVSITFANDPSNNPLTYLAKLTTGQIVITSPAILGHVTLSLDSAVTALFAQTDLSNVSVVVTDAAGKLQTYQITNGLSVFTRSVG